MSEPEKELEEEAVKLLKADYKPDIEAWKKAFEALHNHSTKPKC